MEILISTSILFLTTIVVIELLAYALRVVRRENPRKIRRRLSTSYSTDDETAPQDILRKRILSRVPIVDKILAHTPGTLSLDKFLRQANFQYHLDTFILLTAGLVLIGYSGSLLLPRIPLLISVIIAAVSGAIPFMYVSIMKEQRRRKFMRQLPEALGLIARSMKAGHGFTTGLKMAADEFDDPLGTEFGETLDLINFGVSVSDALKNLANRVDCPDIRYFSVSVILQRETGGNLAEILESIAHIIRERFKLQDKIRVLSAEARLSAKILIAIPFIIVVVLSFMNPEYIDPLLTEPLGRKMAAIAVVMMLIGILVMRRMVVIKV